MHVMSAKCIDLLNGICLFIYLFVCLFVIIRLKVCVCGNINKCLFYKKKMFLESKHVTIQTV